jgi:O-antigen/teichoic acid export membrane protein
MLVFFPTLVEEYHSNRLKFKGSFKKAIFMFSLIGSCISLGFWFFSDLIIILIYGENFLQSIKILNVLAPAVLLFFLNFLLSNVLIASGREKLNAWNLVIATILNIFLNLALIPEYGAKGAAWATLFCEFILVGLMGLQIKKINSQIKPRK